jgi:hypothetical protein
MLLAISLEERHKREVSEYYPENNNNNNNKIIKKKEAKV